ncbi:MAG TPA: PAS domain-containing protein, partial [Archaeoglobaceae archaeon]|nr:PAS domain-containing protein [Archaeoglobaceae archaeon]
IQLQTECMFLRVNDTFSKMVGVSKEEAVNKKCYEVFEGSLCHTPSCPLRRIMNGEKYVEFDSVKKRRDGSLISCIVTAKPFKDSNGNLLGIIEHFRDITDRKIGENKLRESEERWKALYKHIPVPVYIWEKNENSFILTGYNDAAFSITNGKVKECLGKSADEFYRNRPDIIEDFRVCYDEKKIIRKEMDYYYATQDKVMHFIVGYAFAPPDLVFVYTQDITELKEIQSKLEKSLSEKEILLKEVHHRVKNNLQIISSLLNLQKSYIKDDTTLNFLNDSQNRIKTMALIYEKLYQSEDLVRIDFSEYVRSLVSHLIRSYGSADRIKLKVDVDDVQLNIDMAIPCGLIINELVSNSLKHAFPDGKGEIRVEMHRNNGELRLVVSDNGIGMSEKIYFQKIDTLGLQLVNTLANQLSGSIKLHREEGTEFEITFPVSNN